MMAVTPSPRPHQRQHKQFESEENILHVCVDQSINELLFSLGNSHTSGFKLFGTFDLDPNRNNVKRVGSGQVNASINSLPPGTVAHLESRGQNGTLNKT